MMLRIEAGLPLVDVEWRNSRLAFTDHERVTPKELGLGWMLRGVQDEDRAFVGGGTHPPGAGDEVITLAHRRDRRGLAGLGRSAPRRRAAARQGRAPAVLRVGAARRPTTDGGSQVGYVTSTMYSPVLQRHIGLARVRPHLAAPGSEVHMELALNHSNTTVLARTAKLPLFNPARKTATP